jgi:NAD(P)-dependent dehydrogenase (short-subunit alcohol dehydrogenase family)
MIGLVSGKKMITDFWGCLDDLIRYRNLHLVARFLLLGHLNLLSGRFIQSGMDLQLEGKRALVTGSTAGIGFATAKGLAKEGAAVIVNGRSTKRVDEAVAALNKAGISGKLEGLAADLGTAEGTRRAIERFPEVDILVNNLGVFEIKPFENIPDADWLRLFEVNILSGVRLSRHSFPE